MKFTRFSIREVALKKVIILTILILLRLILLPYAINAQTDNVIKKKVDNIVYVWFTDTGIPYLKANSLGPDAVPYLLELLNNPNEKKFWVNIIITLGFIESSESFTPLVSFLENTKGDVDIDTFRALISVPYAIGCIASNGDSNAFNYLVNKVSVTNSYTNWTWQGKEQGRVIKEGSITGLAVSGRMEARNVLLQLKRKAVGNHEQEIYLPHIDDGLIIMDRIDKNGRAAIFDQK